jgi:periplasmic divalent cation tolerance protein
MSDKIVVLSTCGSPREAQRLAHALVEKRLAACVNIVSGVRSVYRWKDAIEDEEEVLLVIKTSRPLFEELRNEILRLHSYEVPEVIALEVVDGSEGYLAWLDRELRPNVSTRPSP